MDYGSSTYPVAKKQHVCDWCCDKIEIGTKYRKQPIFDEGKAFSFKTHKHCDDLVEKLKILEGGFDDGLSSSDFCDFITEEYSKITGRTYDSRNPLPKFAERMRTVREHHKI